MIYTNCNNDRKNLINTGSLFFVDGIQRTLSAEDIEKHFSKFGNIDYFLHCRDKEGRSFGYGWLHFHVPVQNLGVEHVVQNITLRVQKTAGPKETDILLDKIKKYKDISNNIQPISRPKRPLTPCSSGSLSSSRVYCRRRRETSFKKSISESSDTHEFRENNAKVESLTYPGIQVTSSPAISGTSVYVCIPIALCPRAFIADSRVFCASMDASSPGLLTALNFQTKPLEVNITGSSAFPNYYSYYGKETNSTYYVDETPIGVEPPIYAGVYAGMQSKNPPPPGPPPIRGGISQSGFL